MAKDNTTPRSYTLRLRGTDNNDRTWREHLWRTHAAVNLGAKIFGDFLLTFCGGISHKLVDEFAGQKDMGATKDRRIILALSWLSVEDKAGAPEKFAVKENDGKYETVAALREILTERKLAKTEIELWVEDCRQSLEAAIRDDAVWVNRAKAFRALQKEWKLEIDENDLWDFLACSSAAKKFIKPEDYLLPAKDGEDNEKPNMAQAANGWLSNRFGSGEGADYKKLADGYQRIADWAGKKAKTVEKNAETTWDKFFVKMAKEAFGDCELTSQDQNGLLAYLSASGRDSATVLQLKGKGNEIVTAEAVETLHEKANLDAPKAAQKIGGKGARKYADKILNVVEAEIGVPYKPTDGKGRDRRFEYCVMLDHAARKIISRLSWIKNQELRRIKSEEGGQIFEKLKNENPEIVQLLNDYCQERSKDSNADDAYRISKAALGGWEEVVTDWKSCGNETERKEAAGRQQDNDKIKKFGDINLFQDLAKDEYCLLWANADLLENYAAGQQAEYDKRRFKVPAYRHPDPLKHPVYCDYGNSRPNVSFTVQDFYKQLSSCDQQIAAKRPNKNKKNKKDDDRGENKQLGLRELILDLINAADGSLEKQRLKWSGKRLSEDIGIDLFEKIEKKNSSITFNKHLPRLDRFGAGDNGIDLKELRKEINEVDSKKRNFAIGIDIFTPNINKKGKEEDKSWNSRLQVSRKELDQLAKLVEQNGGNPFDKTTWGEKALKMLGHLKWFVSFSPELRYPDAWERYTNMYPKVGAKFPHYSNDTIYRFGIGQLSGIPHLRILAMDLGHRFGASCCVWEVVSKKEIEKIANENGQNPPEKDDLHFVLEKKNPKKKGKNNKPLIEKTWFRRIADDSVKDACWARLERQFTIKLQGEDDAHKPRKTTAEEIDEAKLFLKHLGYELSSEDEKKLSHIDSQLALLVNTTRLALRRHGDLIRIKNHITLEQRLLPGNKYDKFENNEQKTKVLLGVMELWFNLIDCSGWIANVGAKEIWHKHVPVSVEEIKKLIAEEIKSGIKDNSNATDNEVDPRKQKSILQKVLKDLNLEEKLTQQTLKNISQEMFEVWKKQDDIWEKNHGKDKKDGKFAKENQEGLISKLRRMIFPRQDLEKSEKKKKISKEFRKKISRRGGLSMGRINLIRELYQVSKAFYMRPGGGKDKIERGDDSIKNFGQRILKAHEELRRNRVKQLASRIVEAALGLGGNFDARVEKEKLKQHNGKNTLLQLLDKKRDRKAPENPRFAPCHAIVIENLENYRPDQKQTRREARMLMQWASAKIRDLLKEHCQLYGLFLMEVSANYTSRQDSRTGKPGMRCVDVSAKDFIKYWKKQAERSINKKENERSFRDHLIVAIDEKCKNSDGNAIETMKPFRIPKPGGDLFVSTDKDNMGIQADLNAAANIGLKALTDQESPIAHWRVACDRKNGTPVIRKEEKCEILKKAKGCELLTKEQLEKAKGDNNVNAWRDVSTDTLEEEKWEYTVTYWRNVEKAVCQKLAEYNGVGIFDEEETPF